MSLVIVARPELGFEHLSKHDRDSATNRQALGPGLAERLRQEVGSPTLDFAEQDLPAPQPTKRSR